MLEVDLLHKDAAIQKVAKMLFSKTNDILAGYYGFGNFGDDLFRDTLLKAMQAKPWTSPVVSQHERTRLAKVKRHAKEAANLAHARSITLGGGSILGARRPASIRDLEMISSRLRKLPYCAIGVGILERLPDLPRALVNHMSWVGIRSERDYYALKDASSAQINFTSDLAYAAGAHFGIGASQPSIENEVTVIPSGVGELGRFMQSGSISEWMAGNILPLIENNGQLKILVLQPNYAGDAEMSRWWVSAAKELGIPARVVMHQDVGTTLKEISASKFVFTDRLHGAITAHLFEVPFRLSQHHPKCLDFLSDVKHPDADGGIGLAGDLRGSANTLVAEWSSRQHAEVQRHVCLATTGIEKWLAHLEDRIS